MTHITGIRLRNFKRYRGQHEVPLQPTCYAVTASREGDTRRSNHQGKSTFLWAIRFLLTGDADTKTEDDWITHGEKEGEVDIEFSDGRYAERTRARGGPTRLMLKIPSPDGTEVTLLDDEAQAELDRMAGTTAAEQLATWWSEQKRTDFFTTADSSDLTDLVVRWVGLASVREASSLAQGALKTLRSLHDTDVLNETRELEARARLGSKEELQRRLQDAEANLRATEALVAADSKLASETIRRDALKRDHDEYQRLQALVDRHEADKAAAPLVTEAEVDELRRQLEFKRDALREAKQKLDAADKLRRGAFSGCCPVNGRDCPVKDAINADMARAEELHSTAHAAHERARSAHASLRTLYDTSDLALKHNTRLEQQAASHRQQMARLKVTADEYGRLTKPAGGTGLDTGAMLLRDRQLMREAERNLAAHTVADHHLQEAQARLAKLRPELTAHREAVQLLGPAGIQRRMARQMLDEVQGLANEMLATCEIDLEVSFEWERETKQPADACEACGGAFPTSRKVRHCQECGAVRGLKKEQRLRVVVEPKSGGNDNMAGLVARLAVAWWLRRKRDADWSVLCLDEPLGEFDDYNRRAFVTKLQRLALLAGFTQVLLVAHSRDASDAMPARLHITGSVRGSKISVQHDDTEAEP